MKHSTVALAILLLAQSAYGSLHLTPRLSSYELEGVTFTLLVFTDDKKEVTYGPPKGWDYSGNETQLTLHPKDKVQAEATVTRVDLPEPMTFDEPTLKKLTNEALALVPSGSTNVQLLSQENNPVAIEGKPTFLVTLSYTAHGDNYGRSVMFMNRGKEQIRFQLVSRLTDFKELQKAFLASHFSWQNL